MHYSHVVVAATLVKAGSHEIMPFDVEEVRNEDGRQKQDCEINAGKRMIDRIRADDIYAHEPFVQDLRQERMEFVLVAKPTSDKELFEWVTELEAIGVCQRGKWEEGTASKRRYYQYCIARQVPLSQLGKVVVNFVEIWQRDRNGKQLYHNSWITDFEVTKENVAVIVGIGRSRWKIENEHFNVHKNQGYELEHNYGHGQQTLSMVFYLLNLLAFIAHKILALRDHLYHQARGKLSRRDFWQDLRVLFDRILFQSWTAMLEFCLDDSVPADP